MTPASVDELVEIVREAKLLHFGAGLLPCRKSDPGGITDISQGVEARRVQRVETKTPGSAPAFSSTLEAVADETLLELSALTGIVAFEPADQVVVVRAGTAFKALNEALAEHGQCLPVGPGNLGSDQIGTAMALNYPHTLEAQCGTWRDWVLGVTVVQADGTVAKAGSKAVKNVAGYDVQKLFIGARDSLGVVVEVILRTYPIRALPTPDLYVSSQVDAGAGPTIQYIQRVLPTDYARAREGTSVLLADNQTCTLWHLGQPARFEHDWVIEIGKPPTFTDPVQLRFLRAAKDLFDPTHKLNPGVMGEEID